MSEHDTSQDGSKAKGIGRPSIADVPEELFEDGTDWARVLAITDEEAYQNALADDDSQPLAPAQLARMRRAPNPKAIRQRLQMNQQEFARQFHIAVGTLRDWEQGLHLPDSAAIAYLRVIERDSDAVLRALHPADAAEAVDERASSEVNPMKKTG